MRTSITSLVRRMARLEAALKPAPEENFILLIEPDSDATDLEWLSFKRKLAKADLGTDRVGIVRSPCSSGDEYPDFEYFETEFHAWLAVMASQKSQQGRANRLADVLASLNGSVLGVVADPDDCEDEA